MVSSGIVSASSSSLSVMVVSGISSSAGADGSSSSVPTSFLVGAGPPAVEVVDWASESVGSGRSKGSGEYLSGGWRTRDDFRIVEGAVSAVWELVVELSAVSEDGRLGVLCAVAVVS